MPHHELLMSLDDSDYSKLFNSLNRFFEYTLTLLPKKKSINFCYVGTAGNDRFIETGFFRSLVGLKFNVSSYINTSHLLLTSQLTPAQIEEHIRKQDILFVGGGNTKLLLDTWQSKGFTDILTKLKKEDRVPILAGSSAGALYLFDSGLSDYIPQHYTPLKCLGWHADSFIAHADSSLKAFCEFDDNKLLTRMQAFQSAIEKEQLPAGYALPNNCMLHFYDNNLVDALTTVDGSWIYYVKKEKTETLLASKLTHENASKLARTNLKMLKLEKQTIDEEVYARSCAVM